MGRNAGEKRGGWYLLDEVNDNLEMMYLVVCHMVSYDNARMRRGTSTGSIPRSKKLSKKRQSKYQDQ